MPGMAVRVLRARPAISTVVEVMELNDSSRGMAELVADAAATWDCVTHPCPVARFGVTNEHRQLTWSRVVERIYSGPSAARAPRYRARDRLLPRRRAVRTRGYAFVIPSLGYCAPDERREMEEAAEMLARDPEIARTLITHRYPIDDAGE